MILSYIRWKILNQIEVAGMIDELFCYEKALQALKNNDNDTFIALVKDFNLDIRDSYGETLLWKAVQIGLVDFIRILLNNGANINIPDNDGWTPLHIAVLNQNKDIVKLLLSNNPDVNARNKYGNSTIWIAVYYAKGQTDIISLLVDAGADPHQENDYGISAINLAQTISNYDNLSIFKIKGFI